MNFRKDITGLRAIAVLSVILFHFYTAYMPGGFAGVDIFFVISGFLMTSVIFRGIDGDNFYLIKFYYARVKRIIPALTVVVFIVLIIGYFICEPRSYKAMGWHGVSGLLFVSNFFYQAEIKDYVDLEPQYQFIRHLWTLCVEWQFYIIYPIIISGLVKIFSRKVAKYSVPLILITSFIYCIYLTTTSPWYSYFGTFPRIWQMLAGAMIYLFPISFFNKKPVIFETLGILIILICIVFCKQIEFWPSYHSLIPVLGAYFVISANNPNSLLRFSPIQKIGLWSYSMYLVHLPLLCILNMINVHINVVLFMIIVFLLSFTMYKLIESKRVFGYKLLAFYIVTIVLAGYISINGVKDRVPKEFQVTGNEYKRTFAGNDGRPNFDNVDYINATEKDFDYILIGNSFARQYLHYINKYKVKVANISLDNCVSTKHYYSTPDLYKHNRKLCINRYKMEVEFINSHPNVPIILSTKWLHMYNRDYRSVILITDTLKLNKVILNEIEEFIKDIFASNHKLYIVDNIQELNKVTYACLAREQLPLSKALKKRGYDITKCSSNEKYINLSINKELKKFSASHKDVYYIGASESLCKNGTCKILENRQPIFVDTAHLSQLGSEIVGSYIFNSIKKIELLANKS